jgi:hypothetical protein
MFGCRAIESFQENAQTANRGTESAIAIGIEIADLAERAPASRPSRTRRRMVVVPSVFLKPGTGAFEYGSR